MFVVAIYNSSHDIKLTIATETIYGNGWSLLQAEDDLCTILTK